MQSVVVTRGNPTRAAEAEVCDLDVQRCGIRGDPIDSADDLRPSTTSISVENLDRVYGCSRRDTDDSAAVVLSGDGAGDVRAVAIVIVGLLAPKARGAL